MIDLKAIDPDRLYSNAETAAIYQIEPTSLTAKRSRGEGGEFVKVGRAVFYLGRTILQQLKLNVRDPATKARA